MLLQVLYDVWCIALPAGFRPRRKPGAGSDEVSNRRQQQQRNLHGPELLCPPAVVPYSRLLAASACSACAAAESAGCRHLQAPSNQQLSINASTKVCPVCKGSVLLLSSTAVACAGLYCHAAAAAASRGPQSQERTATRRPCTCLWAFVCSRTLQGAPVSHRSCSRWMICCHNLMQHSVRECLLYVGMTLRCGL